jgi:arylsulfatase A-like enzyme
VRTRLRAGLAALAVSISAVASTVGPGATRAVAQARRPNVLVILTDDQRTGLTAIPSVRAQFRRQGRSFPNGFVTTPQCCPSRASIMSGRYAHNHGVQNNTGAANLDQERTFQAVLQGAGYRTGLAGKFLNRWDPSVPPPHFDAWAMHGRGGYYYRGTWNINGAVRVVDEYSTTFIRRRALRFLRAAETEDARPWLLFVSTLAPHGPFQPEPKYEAAKVGPWDGNPAVFESDLSDKPRWVADAGDCNLGCGRHKRRGQLRTLMSVDDLVASVFRLLERTREGNTIAIFLSDNGFGWGEHGLTSKSAPYDHAARVPIYLRWPRHIAPRSIDTRMAANIDIAPTILDAARIPSSAMPPMDGRSLLDETWSRDRILLEHWATRPWASLRATDHQYVEHYDDAGTIVFREYYDLATDRWQLENLLADGDPANDPSPDTIGNLSLDLQRARSCSEQDCP